MGAFVAPMRRRRTLDGITGTQLEDCRVALAEPFT